MGTRYFYDSTNTSGVTPPTPDAAWNKITQATVEDLKASYPTGAAGQTTINGNGTNPNNVLAYQAIGPQIGAGTISGTVKGQAMAFMGNIAPKGCAQLVLKVISADGSTIRGTLLAAYAGAESSDLTTTQTNRKFPRAAASPATLTPVDAQNGDRILAEIGLRFHATATNNSFVDRGAHASRVLPEDETATTTGAAWIEFSADLPPYDPGNLDPFGIMGFFGI